MGLLFYGGVMNIFWIAGLAIYVLIEKVAPNGFWIGRIAGVVLLVWGCWLLTFSAT
jgi:predicted metal-binding membrane protein